MILRGFARRVLRTRLQRALGQKKRCPAGMIFSASVSSSRCSSCIRSADLR